MKRTAYTLALLLVASGMTGCGTLDGKLENRVACTVAKDKLYAVSEFGPIGITSKVAEADRAVICK